jgi:hypothetical protein
LSLRRRKATAGPRWKPMPNSLGGVHGFAQGVAPDVRPPRTQRRRRPQWSEQRRGTAPPAPKWPDRAATVLADSGTRSSPTLQTSEAPPAPTIRSVRHHAKPNGPRSPRRRFSAAATAYTTMEMALPTRRPAESFPTVVPPQAASPNGAPAASSGWKTARPETRRWQRSRPSLAPFLIALISEQTDRPESFQHPARASAVVGHGGPAPRGLTSGFMTDVAARTRPRADGPPALSSLNATRTRREPGADSSVVADRGVHAVLVPADFIMCLRMLRGLARRVAVSGRVSDRFGPFGRVFSQGRGEGSSLTMSRRA